LSPKITRRELLGCVLLGCFLALAMHWPLPLHMGRDIAKDTGDPLVQAWQVAWDGHALAHHPLSWFQANTFWPLRDSLAFSDALIGYAPAGLIGHGTRAAVARYDVLFLFAYALCFVGAWLLARELGAGRGGAAVAGAAFTYCPWRLEQDGHLHVISSGGIPLSLFLLIRGYRRASPGTIVAGWLVAAWQVSLGFSLGLLLFYLLALGAAVVAVVWWRRGRPRPQRRVAIATAAGVVVLLVVAGVLARPYLRVLHDHPEAHRTAAQVEVFSGAPQEFLAASKLDRVWSAALRPVRHSLGFVPEETLFPGLTILALAILGFGWSRLRRRLRIGLGVTVLVLAVLSIGFHGSWEQWLFPYRWLFAVLPGWQGIRVPGRLMTLTSLALALLAAGGADVVIGWARGRGRRGLGAAAAVLLFVAVLAEGLGVAPHPRAPVAPPGLHGLAAPVFVLPASAPSNRRAVLWSTDDFHDLVNGRASFNPRQFVALQHLAQQFPDRASVAAFRRLGIRTVAVRHIRGAGAILGRSLNGLGIERQARSGVVAYDLGGARGP
jgi:hypothetical protein